MTTQRLTVHERLDRLSIPEPNSGCILWLGALNNCGYGLFQGGRGIGTKSAHRASYQARRGAIPPGLTIDHLCRNKACINVDHLEVVTHSVNYLRRSQAKRAGHVFPEVQVIAVQDLVAAPVVAAHAPEPGAR